MDKILILARSNNPYKTVRRDYDYIISNLIELGYSVDIYDPKQRILMKINTKETVSYNLLPAVFYKIKLNIFLNLLSLIYFSIKNKQKYSIVQINYLREEYLVIPSLIRNIGGKLVISLFGSDINKRSFIKNNFNRIFTLANKVIVTNLNFGKIVDSYIKNKPVSPKMKQLMLPQDHFIYYTPFTFANKIESKQTMNYPIDKTIVAIGTNSTENEQHELIIDQIKELTNYSNYYFIFNLSNRYNILNDREKKLIQYIKDTLPNDSYKIHTEFLSYEDMALVRHATDIFVNMRKIDQLAASMLESNLAYSYVITGNWLPYEDYVQSVDTKLISNVSELNKAIESINLQEGELQEKLTKNKQTVLEKYDNDVLSTWLEMYKSVLSE